MMIQWTPKLLTAILIERLNREARQELAETNQAPPTAATDQPRAASPRRRRGKATARFLLLFLTIGTVEVYADSNDASACDKVDYAEAKDWSTPKLEQAYCDTVRESFDRLKDELDHVAPFNRQDQRQCREQQALYKRLLDARDKEPNCRK